MKDELFNFVKNKLTCTDDEAMDFIDKFFNYYYNDIFDTAFEEFRSYFPENFVLGFWDKADIGKLIDEGHLKSNDIKKLFKTKFPEFNCNDLDYNVFEGKTIIPHIKDNAEPFAKRCNAIACTVVLYNDEQIYLRNQIDNKIYIIKTEDFENF